MKIIRLIVPTLILLVGCSPASYRAAAIRDRLSDTPGIAAHEIVIDEASPGYIVLNGNVASDKDRETIEEVAYETSGVRELKSNLKVKPTFVTVREGAPATAPVQRALATEITSQLAASPELKNYRIDVVDTGGIVTLSGVVSTESERIAAESIARATTGVNGVRNAIALNRSTFNDVQISQNVRDALSRRTDLDIRNVEISTRDAIVTLRGQQYRTGDIDKLVSSTDNVPGVRGVRNELQLVPDRASFGGMER